MAHLWIYSSPHWSALPLAGGDLFALRGGEIPPIRPASAEALAPGQSVLRRASDGDGAENWLLLASPRSAWVNGQLLCAGIRLLRDRDEIRLRPGAEPLYFSTEVLAGVTSFPGAPRPIPCVRCHQAIEPGTQAVRCPSCQSWHHQADGCECWTYASNCAVCDQATALDSGYRWTPEEAAP